MDEDDARPATAELVSPMDELSPEGGSRGRRRVVISGSFLGCRAGRGGSRGGSTPLPLLPPVVPALLPAPPSGQRGQAPSAVDRRWYRLEPAAAPTLGPSPWPVGVGGQPGLLGVGGLAGWQAGRGRSEEHTSELQSHHDLV